MKFKKICSLVYEILKNSEKSKRIIRDKLIHHSGFTCQMFKGCLVYSFGVQGLNEGDMRCIFYKYLICKIFKIGGFKKNRNKCNFTNLDEIKC